MECPESGDGCAKRAFAEHRPLGSRFPEASSTRTCLTGADTEVSGVAAIIRASRCVASSSEAV